MMPPPSDYDRDDDDVDDDDVDDDDDDDDDASVDERGNILHRVRKASPTLDIARKI